MTRADVVEHVERMLDAWNGRDLDGFTSFLAPDIVWHDLGMPHPPAVGREEVRRFSGTALRAFPDFRYELRGSVCVSDDGLGCAVPWTITTTNTGVFDPPGFAPTGRPVCFSGIDYIEFRDGLVARIETRFDPAEPLGQLLDMRVRPTPGSWLERLLVGIQRTRAAILRRRPGTEAAVPGRS